MKKTTTEDSTYTIKINRELWRSFKTKCASQGITILAKLTELIKSFVSIK